MRTCESATAHDQTPTTWQNMIGERRSQSTLQFGLHLLPHLMEFWVLVARLCPEVLDSDLRAQLRKQILLPCSDEGFQA